MHCPNCSEEIRDTAKVCGYCGTRLLGRIEAVPEPEPEPEPEAESEPEPEPTGAETVAADSGGKAASGINRALVWGLPAALAVIVGGGGFLLLSGDDDTPGTTAPSPATTTAPTTTAPTTTGAATESSAGPGTDSGTAAGSVAGVVVSGGVPLVGVEVWLGWESRYTCTDAAGRFDFSGISIDEELVLAVGPTADSSTVTCDNGDFVDSEGALLPATFLGGDRAEPFGLESGETKEVRLEVGSAAAGGESLLAGTWSATDPSDGSTMWLFVEPEADLSVIDTNRTGTTFRLTYYDGVVRANCPGSGAAIIDDWDAEQVSLTEFRFTDAEVLCADGGEVILTVNTLYTYDSGTDTLHDSFEDATWRRITGVDRVDITG